jgi:lantibiotic modifying enzyme
VAEHLAVAQACAEGLISGAYRLEQAPEAGGAAFADGFAHGRAGVGYFLSEHHRVTGHEASGQAARAQFDVLLANVDTLAHVALRPDATRRYASWCRGLAGIASTFAIAAPTYEDRPEMLTHAARLVRVCGQVAPRLSLVSQCCGLSGVGEAYLDVALATGDEELWLGARHIAGLILARSGGTPRRPLFPDNSLHTTGWAWGTGTAGVLAFLRRLRDGGGPRLGRPGCDLRVER